MEDPAQIAEFYKSSYKTLRKKAFYLLSRRTAAVTAFRNFSIRDNSLLVITANAMLEVFKGLSNSQAGRPLGGKNRSFCRLGSPQAGRPLLPGLG